MWSKVQTRMERYYEDEKNSSLREHKNEKLYENIGNYKVDDYKLETNATVIDSDARNIDVEHIKRILDTRYNSNAPKRRSIRIEEPEEEMPNISLDETREYDINAILARARSEKEVDYEKERVKKLRDTQFDILKSLSIDKPEEKHEPKPVEKAPESRIILPKEKAPEEEPEEKEENNELMDLINTITTNEILKQKEVDPLDILTDLKGDDDNTMVVGAQRLDEAINETSPIMSLDQVDKIKPSILENNNQELTNTLQFTQSDFDDFNDLKKEVQTSRALIYAIITIVVLIVLVGGFFLFKKFF